MKRLRTTRTPRRAIYTMPRITPRRPPSCTSSITGTKRKQPAHRLRATVSRGRWTRKVGGNRF
jgi:hypothetical protein